MSFVSADHFSIDFPIYNSSARSLKNNILNAATGGRLAAGAHGTVTIKALDDINFEAKAGDRIGILGHNGSGKSTLLRCLAGVYAPTSGRLAVRGKIASLIDINLGIDVEATGMENIIYKGVLMGFTPAEMRRRSNEIAEFTGLENYLYMPVRTYSSGMLVRLGFSIATSIPANILLMDEWLSVGDAEFQKRAATRLEQIVENTDILFLASHSSGLIDQTCNRLIRLEHGKIIEMT